MATVDGKLAKLVRLVRRSLGLSEQTAGRGLPRGYDVVRIAAALLLLVAAALKAHQLATEPVLGTSLLESRWFLIAVVEFEFFFGLWLLANVFAKPNWAAAILSFALFTCVSIYKAISGYATCGCFGLVKVNPWYTTALDLAVVLSLAYWRPKAQGPFVANHLKRPPLRAMLVLAIWLAVGVPAAYAMRTYLPASLSDAGDISGHGKIVVLQPERWVGKRFPLLDYIDASSTLKKGRWLVLLYRHDCPDCQAFLPFYERLASELAIRGEAMRVAIIEVPPYDKDERRWISPGIPCLIGHLSDATNWFVRTPLTVTLDEAVVKGVRRSEGTDRRDRSWMVAARQDGTGIRPRDRKQTLRELTVTEKRVVYVDYITFRQC